jgi:hypothetical protein
MIKLVRGARIVNLGFLSEIITANTHPTSYKLLTQNLEGQSIINF